MQNKPNTVLHGRTKNLLGETFTRLTVIAFAGYRHKGNDQWLAAWWTCRCECGTTLDVAANKLIRKHTRSCGCLRKDEARDRFTIHGQSGSAEFFIWYGIIDRCTRESHPAYANYGGRGITLCEAWYTFEKFYADMGPRPTPQHSIERVNNDAGYSPENCIWATRAVQQRNTRRNHLLTYDGVTLCIQDWAERTGLTRATIDGRLDLGWPLEDVLTLPASHRKYTTRKQQERP